jgi:pimeloyl-ACP methyl ester carboxylesterase
MSDSPPETRTITLGKRTISYCDIGSGPPIVFVHGIFLNSNFWRRAITELAPHFRCIAPDLPLGGHQIPQPADADQTPAGIADLLAELIIALDLQEVTLVGNDTGGAICQILISRRPELVGRLLLTNCDAFEEFFPLLLAGMSLGPRILGAAYINLMAGLLKLRPAQRMIIALGAYRRFSNAELDAYLAPILRDPAIRRDLHRFLVTVSNHYTLEAARTFGELRQPVLLLWGTDDFVFTQKLARRLRDAFPNADLELVPRARAYWPEDQPGVLAERLKTFVGTVPPVNAEAAE